MKTTEKSNTMSDTKHTTGPWKATSYGGVIQITAEREPDANPQVCRIYKAMEDESDCAEANALLIAAAPDLLEELECSARVYELLSHGFDNMEKHNYRGEELENWLNNMRTLLNARIKCNATALRKAGV
jgi:hypothetical protein